MSEKLETPGTAIASLVTGIMGLINPLFSIFFWLPTLICGHMARAQIKKDVNRSGAGFALAGIILGYIQLFVVALLTLGITAIIIISIKEEGLVERETCTRITQVNNAINTYHEDTGEYPSTLTALIEDNGSENWNGPYVQEKFEFIDRWDTPLTYQTNNVNFEIISSGPDRIFETDDDIQQYKINIER
jgi:hypothetical protein